MAKICDNCACYEVCIYANANRTKDCTWWQSKMEWIPVSERLPEDLPENKGKKIIKCIVAHCPYNNGKLTSQFRERNYDKYSDRWYWSKIGGCTVTHWMPLPEPPKEDTVKP